MNQTAAFAPDRQKAKEIREEEVGGGAGSWKITNAVSAHTKGVELEVLSLPTRHLELFAGLGYTRAEIDDGQAR